MSGRFEARSTSIEGVIALTKRQISDSRGFLERVYCSEDLAPYLGTKRIEQINRTRTLQPGTVRGLHYQRPPHAETKIVSCLRGAVFDVAVDLRAGSATFLKWHGEILSPGNGSVLIIPEGFAHGFQTLERDTEMLYLHTARFTPEAEGGLNASDSDIAIAWPEAIAEISPRDAALPFAGQDFEGLML
jgi:dTDP-4-dehydrorhamnose 3,5-epimerase